jgi:hypothetical protein
MKRALPLFVLFGWVACQGSTVGDATSDAGATGGSAGSTATGGSAGSTATDGSAGSTATGGAGVGGASGSGGGAGGSSGSGGGVTGPGPFGALPAGYCCNVDDDCRYRKCVDYGGVKMCSDECDSDDGCNTGQNMKCSASYWCEPSGTPSCIPANQFTVGTKKIGACCVATGDGHSGEECESNRCVAFGDLSNPFICTQPCTKQGGCPAQYQCLGFMFCAPLATLYTCQ